MSNELVQQNDIQAILGPRVAPCRCGLQPKLGYISRLGIRGRPNLNQISAIVITCKCGRSFQEAFDFDETMSGDYSRASDVLALAIWHWGMIQKHDLDGNRPAALDHKIAEAEARLLLMAELNALRLKEP